MTFDELKSYISTTYADKMTLLDTGRHEPIFEVKAAEIVEICQALKDDPTLKFDFLCNLNAVDTTERFEIVYHIASLTKKIRLDMKVVMPYEGATIASIQTVWPAANWYEREMWELYGINITKHDDLRQFLLPDNWDQGHPMRKDWDAPDFVRFPWK